MNPSVVVNQLRAAAVLLTFCSVSSAPTLRVFALWACLAQLAFWLVLKTEYAIRARRKGRSNRRFRGDRGIAQLVLTAAFTPLVLLLAGNSVHGLRFVPTDRLKIPNEVTITVVVAAVVLASSSLIDWYWLRPRRDGVWGTPVCQNGDDRDLKQMTRVLLWHRSITTFVFGGCASIVVYFCLYKIFSLFSTGSFWQGYIAAVNGPVSLVVLALVGYRSGFFEALKILGGKSRIKFGDAITTDVGRHVVSGKVFEVSLEGLTVCATTTGVRRDLPLGDPNRIVVDVAPEIGWCPRPDPEGRGRGICGALDEDEKCQHYEWRLSRDPSKPPIKEVPKHRRPIGLLLPW